MARQFSVVLWDGPHTERLKRNAPDSGFDFSFPQIRPIHDAFDDMIRDQRYDICEMAIGALMQGLGAGKPLLLLPLVMAGGFHHRSLYKAPDSDLADPGQLAGQRIGVRSYSQTTGLWVRGWLKEEYGVDPRDATWVVTEGSHLDGFEDPSNVVMSQQPVPEAIRTGAVAAGILGLSDATDLPSVLTDHRRHARAWYDRHGFTPVNHLMVTTEEMVQQHSDVLRYVYSELAAGIDELSAIPSEPDADGVTLPQARRHGVANVRPALALAADYAFDQGLVDAPVDVDSLFRFDPER